MYQRALQLCQTTGSAACVFTEGARGTGLQRGGPAAAENREDDRVGCRVSVQACGVVTDVCGLSSLGKDVSCPETPELGVSRGLASVLLPSSCPPCARGERAASSRSLDVFLWNPAPPVLITLGGACSGFRCSTLLPLSAPVLSLTLLPDLDSDQSPRRFPLCLI